jgi:hypothetical protein
VMTDGLENASQEFGRIQIKEMIEHQQSKYNWQFTFLGANQDAFAEASSLGMDACGAANYSPSKVQAAYAATGGKVSRMRRQARLGKQVDNAYTKEEREQMSD